LLSGLAPSEEPNMTDSNEISRDARLLDLPFCLWHWDLSTNLLDLQRDCGSECCFLPFIDEKVERTAGWRRVLPEDEATSLDKAVRQQLKAQNRFHARLQLNSPNFSRTIIIHGIVNARDDNGQPVTVSGLARPEFQFAGAIKPEDMLKNTDFEERRRLEALLLKTQRFEGVAKLAGGIAHDLNNLLAPIRMATELLQRKLNDDSLARYINIIGESTDRARSIIQQILTFSRGNDSSTEEFIDANDIIWELKNMISETFPPRIELDFKLGNLPQVKIDPNQLHQALLNILINARDAISEHGRIEVTTYTRQFEIEVSIGNSAIKPGRYTCIAISDTGHGVPDEIRDRIFDPFFTTKQKNQGTGLGLASVYGIVANAGGFIDLESKTGEGSTFYIYLPEISRRRPIIVVADENVNIDLSDHKVLVVDDEENVLQTLVHSFKDLNMDVLGFPSPVKAVEYIQSHAARFDFAVIDLHMPSMSGTTLIQQLRESKCVDHCILITGDINHGIDLHGSGISRVVTKPCRENDFLTAFRDCLQSSQPG